MVIVIFLTETANKLNEHYDNVKFSVFMDYNHEVKLTIKCDVEKGTDFNLNSTKQFVEREIELTGEELIVPFKFIVVETVETYIRNPQN